MYIKACSSYFEKSEYFLFKLPRSHDIAAMKQPFNHNELVQKRSVDVKKDNIMT